MPDADAYDAEVERYYRRNYIANFLDGTFFWGGASFIATHTILPLYVSHFTDSKLLIGLIPTLYAGGWLLPQLFTANWIQRLPRKSVVPVKLGLFTERLPIILMAPAAWWLSSSNPALALAVFLLLFAWHTLGAGVVAVGWQDMIAKIFPLDRRGRFFGVTNFSGTATGVLGAVAATWLLDRYGFPDGYVLSFASAAVLITLSWVFLTFTHEPIQVNQEPVISQREYWRRLPALIQADRNFTRYLLSQTILSLSGMAGGFVAVYAVERWALSDSQAGTYTAVMLIGQAVANLIFGSIADRKGHKLVLELSILLGTAAIGLAYFAPSPTWFYAIFALIGGSFAGFILSGIMIAFEFGPPEARATYIGLNSTVSGVAASVAPLLGGWLAGFVGYQGIFLISFVIGLAAFATLRWWVCEPRQIKALKLKTVKVDPSTPPC